MMSPTAVAQRNRQPLESDGHIELLSLLGSGGFARTYLARVIDPKFRKKWGTDHVALKIPLDEDKLLALINEVELNSALHARLSGLRSNNIVRYLGAGLYNHQLVMATEYQPQGSLRARLGPVWRQKPLPVNEAVEIALGTLRGLQVLSELQVVHRDIKPENILLNGSVAKVTDFGISRILDQAQQTESIIGTWNYTAPEILRGAGIGLQVDVWSLGVTLYEMLTGCFPFGKSDTSVPELFDQIRDPRILPQPPRDLNQDVSPELSDIVLRALRKPLAERYASAADMCRDLERMKSPGMLETVRAAAPRESMEDEDTVKAERSLRARVETNPRELSAYRALAAFYRRWTRFTEAIDACERGLAVEPRDALLYLEIAKAYQPAGRERLALWAIERAIALGLTGSDRRQADMLQRSLERALA